ncbi:hypothetical protein D1AOALGA4SA_1469 [Olavius algarvensis Delta 1 endosymbiont]|nr:hypothetical protein D1AOALGA4SA_1469 [Olavius algarvensis Delta 1 endosymbiont]
MSTSSGGHKAKGLMTGYYLTLSTVKSQQGDSAIESIAIAR